MDTHLVSQESLRGLVTTFVNDILAHSQRQQPSAAVPFYDRTIGLQLTSQSSSALRILHEDIAILHRSPLEHDSQRSGTEDASAEKQTVRLHSSGSSNTEAVNQSIGKPEELSCQGFNLQR